MDNEDNRKVFVRYLDDYVNSIRDISNLISKEEKGELFQDLRKGSHCSKYSILKKHDLEFAKRNGESEVIVDSRYCGNDFKRILTEDIKLANKKGIKIRYFDKKGLIKLNSLNGTIDYELTNPVSSSLNHFRELEKKTFYLNLRDEKATNARKKLIESNLRMALKVASSHNIPLRYLEDIVMNANLGLIDSIDSFDLDKANGFNSYIVKGIKSGVRHFLSNSTSDLKSNYDSFIKEEYIKKAEREFIEENSRIPLPKELFDFIGEKENRGEFYSSDKKISEESFMSCINNRDICFNSIDLEKEDYSNIKDKSKSQFEDVINRDYVNTLLSHLKEDERELISRRYGLLGFEDKVLKDIGVDKGLSTERIRQKIKKIFLKLNRVIYKTDSRV